MLDPLPLQRTTWLHHAEQLRRVLQRLWRTRVTRPYARSQLDAYSIPSGVGDEVMAAGVLQAAKRVASDCEIIFHTRYPELFSGLEGVDQIVPYLPGTMPPAARGLTYFAKSKLPVMAQMASCVGLSLEGSSISLPRHPRSEIPPELRKEGVKVVIQTTASSWTPNKQWPEHHWKTLIESLPEGCHVLELGKTTVFSEPPAHQGYCSLVGNTSLLQYSAAIQEADVFVGPISAGMHLAHGHRVPSVIIIGGYELAHPYPLSLQLCRSVPCAPCWLREPCPYERRCLEEILPGQVLAGVLSAIAAKATPASERAANHS